MSTLAYELELATQDVQFDNPGPYLGLVVGELDRRVKGLRGLPDRRELRLTREEGRRLVKLLEAVAAGRTKPELCECGHEARKHADGRCAGYWNPRDGANPRPGDACMACKCEGFRAKAGS